MRPVRTSILSGLRNGFDGGQDLRQWMVGGPQEPVAECCSLQRLALLAAGAVNGSSTLFKDDLMDAQGMVGGVPVH